MGNAAIWRLVRFRGLYVLSVLVIALAAMLPLGTGSGRLPGPDLIVVLTIAWAMRRADHLPVALLAATLLLADLLLMRPPGLLAAIVVLTVEFIRARRETWSDLPFLAEWAIGAGLLAGIALLNAVCLAIFFVPQPPVGQTLIRLLFSILVYPAAVACVLYVFGVRHALQVDPTAGAKS